MKKLLLIIIPLLLIIGCSKPVEFSKLTYKEGLAYLSHSDKTFSGHYFENDSNGNRKGQGLFKNGVLIKRMTYRKSGYNLFTTFYDNGNKKNEYFIITNEKWKLNDYESTKYDSSFTSWYLNGQKKSEGIYKNGKKDGLWTSWYPNGQKKSDKIWTFGEITSIPYSITNILLNQKWCYPDCGNDLENYFNFNSDGSFNFNTLMFSKMSRSGKWVDNGNGTVLTNDKVFGTQKIEIISKNDIKVGSINYTNR